MPDESLDILNRTTADACGGTQAAAALNQTSDAAKRLQAIFDSTRREAGSGESAAKARDTAENLGRGFGELAGRMREGGGAANQAQMAYDQPSQDLHEDLTRAAKDLDNDIAKLRGDKPAQMGLVQARQTAAENAVVPAKQPGPPGAFGDRAGAAATAEAGETAGAKSQGGRALTQQGRDVLLAGDEIDPAMKALLVEVAKLQDQHVNGLKQAVAVMASHSTTVEGLAGLMRTIAAHQEQLRSDVNAHAQQLAAWARTTQIP
jgi:hypothetical protein